VVHRLKNVGRAQARMLDWSLPGGHDHYSGCHVSTTFTDVSPAPSINSFLPSASRLLDHVQWEQNSRYHPHNGLKGMSERRAPAPDRTCAVLLA
jgi:hypothetical protein